MQLHDLQKNKALSRKKRVGRGGRRGKTSGRGMKGQKARAGSTPRPEIRDTIKKIPKKRGYGQNRSRTINSGVQKPLVFNVSTLEKYFQNGDTVNRQTLAEKGLVSGAKKMIPVKILGDGTLKKKLIIEGIDVSKSAQDKIEKAGGSIK